jgi:glycosyltransferase involved in cell wall biosynthesis
MISVCIATKNGSRYLGEQLESILCQLGSGDEIIISDDASSDNTVDVIKSFHDSRIKIFQRKHSVGVVSNFEHSLIQSEGDIIFLADQDDVWLPGKVDILMQALQSCDLVVSDAAFVDQSLKALPENLLIRRKSQKGFVRNLLQNSYMGCCMAFRRQVLDRALPFPKDIPMHDIWIGLVAEMYFDILVIPDQLVLHRRHQHNASTTGLQTRLTLRRQFTDRYKILKNLIFHRAHVA